MGNSNPNLSSTLSALPVNITSSTSSCLHYHHCHRFSIAIVPPSHSTLLPSHLYVNFHYQHYHRVIITIINMLSSTFHRHPANVFIINIIQSSFVSTLSSPELSCQYQHCQIIYGMNALSNCHHVNPIMITTPNQIIANVPSFIMLPSSHYNIVTLQQHCYHQHIKMTVNIVISNVITNIDMLSPSLSVRRQQELITNALVKQQCNNQMVIERCHICHCHCPYHA